MSFSADDRHARKVTIEWQLRLILSQESEVEYYAMKDHAIPRGPSRAEKGERRKHGPQSVFGSPLIPRAEDWHHV